MTKLSLFALLATLTALQAQVISGPTSAAIPVGKTLYVDSVNGVDATGLRGRADKPFLTLLGARTAANSGDTIIVLPGTYHDVGLAKAGVTYQAVAGAVFDGSNDAEDTATLGGTNVGPLVTGDGRFELSSENDFVIYTNSTDHYLNVATIKQTSVLDAGAPIYLTDGHAADKIVDLNVSREISTAAVNDNTGPTSLPASAIWWQGATLYVNTPRISGRASVSFDCAVAANAYIHADDIIGRIQTASNSGSTAGVGSGSAALWVSASTLRPHSTLNSATVLSQNSPNKFYLTAQKMFGSAFIGAAAGPSYLTVDKWEATASASGSANVFADIQSTAKVLIKGAHLDPRAFTGASITSSGNDVTIDGLILIGNSGLDGLSITGGTLNLVNCYIDTSANTSTDAITVSGGTVNVQNCHIISGAGRFDLKRTGGTLTVAGTLYDSTKTSGTIAQGENLGGHSVSAYASGTAYTMTGSDALVDFGTTDPTLTIDQAGTYLVMGRAYLKYNGATYATTQTATVHLRRTNNTAADITNATTTATMRVITTITDSVGVMTMPAVIYTTANANDVVSVYGSLSATPAAGSVQCSEASILAIRLF